MVLTPAGVEAEVENAQDAMATKGRLCVLEGGELRRGLVGV